MNFFLKKKERPFGSKKEFFFLFRERFSFFDKERERFKERVVRHEDKRDDKREVRLSTIFFSFPSTLPELALTASWAQVSLRNLAFFFLKKKMVAALISSSYSCGVL